MNEKTYFRFEQLGENKVHKLYIYDDVTEYGKFNWNTWEYEESETGCKYFRDQLNEIPEDAEIELHINSCGGSVKEGIAIYNLLKQHKAHKTCYVDGFAYSIASVICLACDKVIMGVGTSMLIHNMALAAYGNAETLRKYADDLDTLMEGNRKIYLERMKGVTEDELKEMMEKETYLTPDQCLEYGLCDEIGTYKADETKTAQRANKEVKELKEQLESMRQLKKEMQQFMKHTEQSGQKDKKAQNGEKMLKMMSAFLESFERR